MMYANKTIHGGNFSHLMPAFSGIGVTDENIQIAEQYLNLENPRDDSLLDNIQQQDFSKYFHTYNADTQAIIKAVKKDINRLNSDELEERFYLLIYAIAGVTCSELGLYEVGATGTNYDKRKNKIINTLRTRYGEDAEAIYLAVNSARYSSNAIGSYGMETSSEKPEICLKAISYLWDYTTKLKLVISAMNSMNPQPQNLLESVKSALTGKKADVLVQQALKIVDEEIIPGRKSAPQKNAYLMALALASGYDEKYFILFKSEFNGAVQIFTEWVLKSQVNKPRILDIIERAETPVPKYIGIIAHTETNEEHYWRSCLKSRDSRLKNLAKNYPDAYKQQMNAETDIAVAKDMEKILKSVDSSYNGGDALREKARQNCIDTICKNNSAEREQIQQYLYGSMSSEDFVRTVLPTLHPTNAGYGSVKYVSAFGLDEFAERCICYRTMKDYDSFYYPLNSLPGYELKNHEEKVIEILRKHAVPMSFIMNGVIKMAENEYSSGIRERAVKKFCEFADEIAKLDTNSLIVEARCARIEILGESGKYKYLDELFASAEDSSKRVRELLVKYLPAPSDEVNQKILNLIQGKKIAQREIAVALLEKNFPDSYQEAVQKAFDAEKNEKLKNRLSVLLNAEIPEVRKAVTSANLIDDYSKGNKAKKTAWLFQNPFTPVHDKDGNEVEEKYLIALTNCYASMDIFKFSRSKDADTLAQNLNQTDLERFAQEVFSRFIDKGAEAKQKWVIYFTGILGGMDAVTSLQHYIKEWSEHSRGAIASEAVKALAFSGSSAALMAVDAMARKFKNKQVRNAANRALTEAADALNITREELADKIVPDLGFDESLCRIFDYGQRQFKVYLTPALELEIFEGDKKLKTLPKPGKNDDPEKSEQASREFKEMKKQMKTTVQSQKARLEYVLLCDRKWSAESWKELFIRKPVMHCFAIGLIWGAYDEKNNLLQTFRYMEDGSFTTSDEDEYELPEHVQIGLVHPIELSQESISAWNEQLSDYEISQPFPQINRPVYRILPEEKGKTALQRFSGTELSNLSLINKMTKIGWEKGHAEDAGIFYDFCRTDIAKQEKDGDKIIRDGYYAELRFSGTYIAAGYMDSEDVSLEDVKFWKLTDKIEESGVLNLEDINARYFSEIIAQLTEMFGKAEEQDA